MFVSVTRLRIRKLLYMLPFFLHNERVVKQTVRAPGYLGGSLFVDARRTFWTLTAWETKAAMMAYRNADAHRTAMPKLQQWCDEASVAHWEQEDSLPMPTWPEAHKRMMEEGRKSKVRNPSADHEDSVIAPPRWPNKIVRPLMPKG
jgi:hypothetical protein